MREYRIGSLDGMRTFLFVMIVINHSEIVFGTGEWAVSFFLILSGFCMFLNHYNRDFDALKYVKNKYNRVLPLHVLMTIVALPIAILTSPNNIGIQPVGVWIQKIFLDVMCIQSFVPIYKYFSAINVPAWFLSPYLFCLIMSKPIIGFINSKQSKILIIIFIIGVILLQGGIYCLVFHKCSWIRNGEYTLVWFTYRFPIMRLFDFFAGVCIGKLYCLVNDDEKAFNNRPSINYSVVQLGLVIVIIMLIKIGYINGKMVRWASHGFMFFAPNCLLCFSLSFEKGILSKILNTKFLTSLTKYIMQAFIIHHVVLDYLKLLIRNKILLAIIVSVVSMTFGVLYHKILYIKQK